MSPTRFFLALVLASAASAAEPPPLSLRDALATALQKNPALRAQAFESRVAEARIAQAAVRPNPELSVTAENFLGTGALSGVKSLETTLQLSQAIDLGDTRARRVATAETERALADTDYQAKRLDVLADVARRFTEAVADAERLADARSALALAEQTVAAVRTRVDAAVAPRTELNRALTALALLRIEEEHAEHELPVCRQPSPPPLARPSPPSAPSAPISSHIPPFPSFPPSSPASWTAANSAPCAEPPGCAKRCLHHKATVPNRYARGSLEIRGNVRNQFPPFLHSRLKPPILFPQITRVDTDAKGLAPIFRGRPEDKNAGVGMWKSGKPETIPRGAG